MTRSGLRFTLPSIGNNTGRLECHLGRGNQSSAVQRHHRISADGSYGPQTRGGMLFAADNGGAGVCRQYGS